jgi:hypothetical protein
MCNPAWLPLAPFTWATATAMICFTFAGYAPSANTALPKASNAAWAAGARSRRCYATSRVVGGNILSHMCCSSRAGSSFFGIPRLQKRIAQDDRIVMRFIVRCEDQCNRATPGQFLQFFDSNRLLLQLSAIAATEFGPALRVMAEPLAQLSARRDILHPAVDCRIRLAQPAWPQSIDQHAHAIVGCRGLINPFQPYTARR